MQEIGAIPYLTLEQEVETEWEALKVYQNKTNRDLYFRTDKQLPPEIRRELPNLASCMQWNTRQLYRWYAPLFEDQNKFGEMVKDIVCKRTFFERSDAFKKKHPYDTYAVGLFCHRSYSALGLKIIEAGSHIKIKNTFASQEIKITLFHEYAHEMHHQSCKEGISCFKYNEYDRCIIEVIALNAERKVKKEEYPKRYQSDVRLVERLERIPEFSLLPFHQQWKYLLQFKTRGELIRHLRQKEV